MLQHQKLLTTSIKDDHNYHGNVHGIDDGNNDNSEHDAAYDTDDGDVRNNDPACNCTWNNV